MTKSPRSIIGNLLLPTTDRFSGPFVLLTECMALTKGCSVPVQGYNHHGSVGMCPNYLFPSRHQVGLFLAFLSTPSNCAAHSCPAC